MILCSSALYYIDGEVRTKFDIAFLDGGALTSRGNKDEYSFSNQLDATWWSSWNLK